MGDSGHSNATIAPLEAGAMLGDRFRLIESLGEGSIGVVWLAEDAQLDGETVACKVLREELQTNREALSALKREVLLTRKMRHPNILALYTFWETPSAYFVTMEYVDGYNLAEALADRGKPFTVHEILPWLKELAAALDYAHAQGVLHRDVKPANVLVGSDGHVRLGDFGIANLLPEGEVEEAPSKAQGTLYYMSPELLSGGPTDLRSDLYSLAATVYELLKGSPPFHSGDILAQIQIKPAPPIGHLSEDVNRVLLRALAKPVEKRQPSCGDFYNAFAEAASGLAVAGALPANVKVDEADRATVVLGDLSVGTRRTRLGRLLIEEGTVTQGQLADALLAQAETGEKLGAALTRLGHVTEEAVATTLSRQLQIPFVHLDEEEIDREVALVIPGELAEEHLSLPLRRTKYGVLVAMADPLDMEAINALEGRFGDSVDPVVANESSVREAIGRIYGS